MRSLPLAFVSLAALVLACTKSESSPPTPESTSTTASAPAIASSAPEPRAASASATASAEPVASASAAPATGDAGKTAAATTTKDGGGGGSTECGTKPLPDCPLQAWMKKNMNPPSLSGDTAALAAALEKAATFAPPGYTNWKSISDDGAKAAKGGDLAAAKASCRSCHDQYKKKYQGEMRGRSI